MFAYCSDTARTESSQLALQPEKYHHEISGHSLETAANLARNLRTHCRNISKAFQMLIIRNFHADFILPFHIYLYRNFCVFKVISRGVNKALGTAFGGLCIV